jgi:hypothetical protein
MAVSVAALPRVQRRGFGSPPVVFQAGDQLSVGGTCGVEFLVSLVELAAQVDHLLLKLDDPVLQLLDVGRSAEPGPRKRHAN